MPNEITFTGPMFDGHAVEILRKAINDIGNEVAGHAEFVWQMKMDDSFRHPTGAYQSHINVARRDGTLVVNDAGVVYGPWLEGTGSRNAPVTRFKGYGSARYAALAVDKQVDEIAAPILDRAVQEINRG